MDSVDFLGVPIHALTLEAAVARCLELLDDPRSGTTTIAHINPHSLVVARSDPAFRSALRHSDLRLPDGAGLLLVAKLRGTPLPGRVPGPDFVLALHGALARRGGARVFFYGSTAPVLAKIRERVAREWPAIVVVGAVAPPFHGMRRDEEAFHVSLINEACPDILWVGMTAPKQECWVHRNREGLRVPLVGCVGASFDYLAETKVRSPLWLREHGLEWLPRLLREPRRLWRRTLVSAPLFLWYSLLESAGRRSPP